MRSFLRKLAGVPLLLLVATPALATTYFVSPAGLVSNSGTSLASPWPLSQAIAQAIGGDVVYLADGAYVGDLRPANSGISGSRISYVGDIANPGAVALAGSIDLTAKRFITVKGVSANGDIHVSAYTAAQWSEADSVIYCAATGSLDANGAQNCHVCFCTVGDGVGGDRWEVNRFPTRSFNCTFRNNVMHMGGMLAQPHAIGFDRATNCEWTNNVVTVTMIAGATDVHGRIQYGLNGCTFKDNKWMIINNTSFNNYIFAQRDSCRFNTYIRDTVLELPQSTTPAYIRFATAGSYPGTNAYNTFINCVFKANFTMDYQNDTRGDNWFGCTLISTGQAMDFEQVFTPVDSLTIRHCTFYTSQGLAMDARKTTNFHFVSNVIYSSGSACPGVYLPIGTAADSNLYFQATGSSGGAVGQSSGACVTVGSGSSWCSVNGNDCHSLWGSPKFIDSTYSSFDPHLRTGSLASGSSWRDGYVGAIPFGAAGVDSIPPSAVADLTASQVLDRSLVLGWTTPGNDGNAGTAYVYDFRYSTSPINTGNFSAATAAPSLPAPLPAGSHQTYAMLGLTPSTPYYFAMKSRDLSGNWSGISNVASATTPADTTPPAAIKDLRGGP
jgi:hypothetical protein